jgi:hypothetical protein
MRKSSTWMLAGAMALTSTAGLAADGDTAASPDQLLWARWQGRLSLGSTAPAWRLGIESPSFKVTGASLMGDYYFKPSLAPVGALGGFRATSGLIFGSRSSLNTGQPASLAAGNAFSIGSRLFGTAPLPNGSDAAGDAATVPYLGVGYTGLQARGGWSFSADLGLVAQSPGNAVRLGRVFSGTQSLDDVVRDMRLAPLLQLGVSYAF